MTAGALAMAQRTAFHQRPKGFAIKENVAHHAPHVGFSLRKGGQEWLFFCQRSAPSHCIGGTFTNMMWERKGELILASCGGPMEVTEAGNSNGNTSILVGAKAGDFFSSQAI